MSPPARRTVRRCTPEHSSPRLRRRSKLSRADQVQVLKTPEPELLGVAEAARDISSSLVDSKFRLPNKGLVFSVPTSYGGIEFSKKRERLETKELERKAKMREDRLRRMQVFQASSILREEPQEEEQEEDEDEEEKQPEKMEDDQYDIERSQPKQNQLMKILFIRPMRLLRRKMNLMTP